MEQAILKRMRREYPSNTKFKKAKGNPKHTMLIGRFNWLAEKKIAIPVPDYKKTIIDVRNDAAHDGIRPTHAVTKRCLENCRVLIETFNPDVLEAQYSMKLLIAISVLMQELQLLELHHSTLSPTLGVRIATSLRSFFALRAGFAGCAAHTPAGVIVMTNAARTADLACHCTSVLTLVRQSAPLGNSSLPNCLFFSSPQAFLNHASNAWFSLYKKPRRGLLRGLGWGYLGRLVGTG